MNWSSFMTGIKMLYQEAVMLCCCINRNYSLLEITCNLNYINYLSLFLDGITHLALVDCSSDKK